MDPPIGRVRAVGSPGCGRLKHSAHASVTGMTRNRLRARGAGGCARRPGVRKNRPEEPPETPKPTAGLEPATPSLRVALRTSDSALQSRVVAGFVFPSRIISAE